MQQRQWAGPGQQPQRQPSDPTVDVVPGDWGKWQMGTPPQLPVPVNQRRPVDEPALDVEHGRMEQPSRWGGAGRITYLGYHDTSVVPTAPAVPTLVPATNIQDESKQRFSATWDDGTPKPLPPPWGGADRITDADKQRIRGMVAEQKYQKKPESFVFDEMPWAFRKRALQAFAAGSTNSQAALAERYPGIREAADRVFNAPESAESRAAGERENRLQESYYGPRQPQPSSLRQHTEAQYGPRRGTGEGIPGDVARMMGGVEGAGGLAGRTAAIARDESRFPLGIANAPKKQGGYVPSIGPIVTKYNLPPDEAAAERERKMNAGYARAMAERERKINAGEDIETQELKRLYKQHDKAVEVLTSANKELSTWQRLVDEFPKLSKEKQQARMQEVVGLDAKTPEEFQQYQLEQLQFAKEAVQNLRQQKLGSARKPTADQVAANQTSRADKLATRNMMRQLAQVRVRTDADYAKLRPGTYFIGPDGKPRRKP